MEPPSTDRRAYHFDLPKELIAQKPLDRRDDSRLLVLDRRTGDIDHQRFPSVKRLLRAGDLLVLNDTRVLAARVVLLRSTGGRVRGLFLEVPRPPRVRMMLESRGRLAEGETLVARNGAGLRLERSLGAGFWEVAVGEEAGDLLATGRMPLPPYIRREDPDETQESDRADELDRFDRERYQTVFARQPGAVAAPTAGLHFTEDLLEELRLGRVGIATITLHVGPGTFLPVRVDDLSQHRMHAERYHISPATAQAIAVTRASGGRVVAVGTTVVRALESAMRRGLHEPDEPDESGRYLAGSGDTDLFVRPPFSFLLVDAMLTNFHLPESTLLMLVSAFAGRDSVLSAYREAVKHGYRFFSYGDAMFIS